MPVCQLQTSARVPGPEVIVMRKAATASASTMARAMKSGERFCTGGPRDGPPLSPLVDREARLALRLQHRESIAHEPHALPGTQPDVLGLGLLGDPDVARLHRDAPATRAFEPQE